MKKHLAGPIKKIALRGIHVRREFKFGGGGNKLSIFLLDLRKQVV